MGKDLKGKKLPAGILGHANIGITMNLYVHNTEEEKEIKKFEEAFGVKLV